MTASPAIRSGIINDRTDKNRHVRYTGVRPIRKGVVVQQEFTAPGTWTRPEGVDFVEVLVVSGGGAGQTQQTTVPVPLVASTEYAGAGGVGVFTVNVTGPVPVIVGAGGTATPYPVTPGLPVIAGGSGGSSGFGSIGTPPIPADAVWIEGGLGAGVAAPTSYPWTRGGGTNSSISVPALPSWGSTLYSAGGRNAGSWGSSAAAGQTSTAALTEPNVDSAGLTRFTYGAGARAPGYFQYGAAAFDQHLTTPTPHLPNRGHAGRSFQATSPGTSTPLPVSYSGQDGSSGIVIVRWIEDR